MYCLPPCNKDNEGERVGRFYSFSKKGLPFPQCSIKIRYFRIYVFHEKKMVFLEELKRMYAKDSIAKIYMLE